MHFLRRRAVKHPLSAPNYTFRANPIIYSAGAQGWVFEDDLSRPLQTVNGQGVFTRGQLDTIPSAQPVVALPAVSYAGLGGLQAGQLALTPLTDNVGAYQ